MTEIVIFNNQKDNPVQDKNYTPPKLGKNAFNCPNCGTYAHQEWDYLCYQETMHIANAHGETRSLIRASICQYCSHLCLWCEGVMIYPDVSNAPPPNEDLPEKALANYKEAASIFSQSPRAAAAMLRLAVQDICVHLGGKGKNMQDDIDYLMKEKGLSTRLVKAMDAVRIVGNEAIHPGEMDLQDDTQTVGVLFGVVNRIAEKLIAEPRTDDEFYNALPDSKKRKNIPKE